MKYVGIIYLTLSFILDNLMSLLLPSTLTDISYFTTIYIIISFVVIYPYLGDEKKFYILLVIFGLLFDILYTGTFIFNVSLFLVIGICIKLLYNVFPENVFTMNVISLISIIIYHFLSFVIVGLISSINYDFILFINIVLHSLAMTIIYTSISYFALKVIGRKFNVKYIK